MNQTATFAGLPAAAGPEGLAADIAVVGIPHGTPYRPGDPDPCAAAPSAVRRASARYAPMLTHYDFDFGGALVEPGADLRIVDCGDLPGDPGDAGSNRRHAADFIAGLLRQGVFPAVLGGDDSVPIAVLRGYEAAPPMTLVQIDAHIDWRDRIEGETEGRSSTMRRASEMPWIEGIVQVGIRGVGSARKEDVEAAEAYGARIVTASELAQKGVSHVLSLVPEGSFTFLTIDCDGLDPAVCPGVASPSPGGMTYLQAISLIHGLARKTDLRGFDIVELAPEKDPTGLSALVAARITLNLIGSLTRSTRFRSVDRGA